jgi:hypothetical protein
MSELTHAVEALLFVAPEPLSVQELAALTDAPSERIERALDMLGDRYGEGRSGIVLERVAGGWGFRASAETAEVCARLVDRPSARGVSQAAMETLAIVAYLQPVSRPEIARIRGVQARVRPRRRQRPAGAVGVRAHRGGSSGTARAAPPGRRPACRRGLTGISRPRASGLAAPSRR